MCVCGVCMWCVCVCAVCVCVWCVCVCGVCVCGVCVCGMCVCVVCVCVCRGHNSELKIMLLFRRRQLVLIFRRDLICGSSIAWWSNFSRNMRNQHFDVKYLGFLMLAESVKVLCSNLKHEAISVHWIWLMAYQLRKQEYLERVGP